MLMPHKHCDLIHFLTDIQVVYMGLYTTVSSNFKIKVLKKHVHTKQCIYS